MDGVPTDLQYKLALAIGSIAAALITGLFNLTSLIISKDKEITDHKKDWIGKLREELSIVLGEIATLLILVEKEIPAATGKLDDTALNRFRRRHAEHYVALNNMYHRVKLRLNNQGHGELISALDELYKSFYGDCYNMDTIRALESTVKIKAQKIIEQELNEIKKGEPTFQRLLNSITVAFLLLVIVLFGIIGYMAIM